MNRAPFDRRLCQHCQRQSRLPGWMVCDRCWRSVEIRWLNTVCDAPDACMHQATIPYVSE